MKSHGENSPLKIDEIRKIRRYAAICSLLWTTLLSFLFAAYFAENRQAIREIGRSMALASFEKDILFRRWATRHGDVYVPETAVTPANPYLAHIPERDITTPSGRRLTLVNPAYLSRQIFELARERPDLPQGHITSLNPLRSENNPDPWEMQALKILEQGAKEVVEPVVINGQPHLRFMRPLITEKPCLTCHSTQGYQEGNGRGGVSVTLSLVPIIAPMNGQMQQVASIHAFIWLLGLGFIWVGTRKISRTMTLLRNERNSLIESEEKLLRNQRQLADIIDFLPDATLAVDREKRIIIWNRAIEEMTGVPAAEMLGKGEYACTIPFYGEARPHLMDLVFEERKELESRYPHITRKGDTLKAEVFCPSLYNNKGAWVFAKASPLHDQSGNTIGAIESIRDVTQRKRAEAVLAESEERYRALFTRAGDGIFIMSTDGKLIEVNDSFARMHGYSVLEIKQMSLQDLDTPETFRLAPGRIRRLLAGELMTFEVEHYHKDGHVFPLEVSASLIPSGGENYIQCFHRDITERKQAEEERRQLEQQFHHAQKLESLGVLAGGIAHDFNNILTVILGHCYLAREDLDSEQEYKTSFLQIESAANRAADLCRQMLTYSGKSESVKTGLSLWLLVDEVVKMLKAAISKNVTIELDLKHDVPEIMGDIGQIQQIVMNLIINAAEAIGGANGDIRVALSKLVVEANTADKDAFGTPIHVGSYACLQVTDTGCGMDEETQKRIFEPFFTTKFTGRGLGMSAIRGIVKAHDGFLLVTSTPGVGTKFKVCFPLPDISYQDSTTTPAILTPSAKAGTTILLVDDEETLCNMGINLLASLGFATITAQHGLEAVEIYRERSNEIDMILLDLIMPVMGGIDAYRELRSIAPTLPIVFCSGYSVESVSDIIKHDEHAAFVHKPYKPEELRNILAKLLHITTTDGIVHSTKINLT
ncbi:MAG: PAS domain S-box protein [Desulfuromonadales bacterium]